MGYRKRLGVCYGFGWIRNYPNCVLRKILGSDVCTSLGKVRNSVGR